MAIKKKNTQVLAVYKGSMEVAEIYLGGEQIYPYNVVEQFKESINIPQILTATDGVRVYLLTPINNVVTDDITLNALIISDNVNVEILNI